MLLVLGLMGAQAALFGPAKLGSIPEMVDESRISAANGLIGLTTVFATMVGTVVGSVLADVTGDKGQEHWQWTAVVLLGIADRRLGRRACSSRGCPRPIPTRQFPWDMAQQTLARPQDAGPHAGHAPRGAGHLVLLDARRAGPPEHRPVRLRGRSDASRSQMAPLLVDAGHRHRRRQRAGRHLVGGPRRAGHPAAGRPAGWSIVSHAAVHGRRRVLRTQRRVDAQLRRRRRRCCSCWAAPAGCSTCRWPPTCSTTARRSTAARSWPRATSSPSAAC